MNLALILAAILFCTMLNLTFGFLSTSRLARQCKLPNWTPVLLKRSTKMSTSTSTPNATNSGQSPVRVRFAPSPTGSLHIGGARTALFNWLFARKYKGKFIVRVEDTDEARSSRASEFSIIKDLKWLGLDFDEGPDIGGDFGPYRQSERKEIYKAYAEQLIKSGHAYRCFCTNEELESKKEALAAVGKPNTYDGTWRDRDPAEVQQQLEAGTPFTVRFKVPDRKFFINDMVRGRVVWNPSAALGDFIIMRSSGMPVYNFCVAIDDYLMKISHVIRAEEHLSNTIKQILIFDAMGAKHPEYAHCSLILGADKQKLSKRHGAASLAEFEANGYFPSAMRNYLAMLGWNSGTNKEIFTDAELVEAFDPTRIVKSPAVFDTTRLNWVNSQHISLLPAVEFQQRCEVLLRNSSTLPLTRSDECGSLSAEVAAREKEFVQAACALARGNLKFMEEVVPATSAMLRYPFAESSLEKRGIKTLADEKFLLVAKKLVSDFKQGTFARPSADTCGAQYDPEEFDRYLSKTAEELGLLGKSIFFPARLALTGSMSGPEMGSQLRLLEIARVLLGMGRLLPGDASAVDVVSLDTRMEALEDYINAQDAATES